MICIQIGDYGADQETCEGCSVTCFPFDYPLQKVGAYLPDFIGIKPPATLILRRMHMA